MQAQLILLSNMRRLLLVEHAMNFPCNRHVIVERRILPLNNCSGDVNAQYRECFSPPYTGTFTLPVSV
ncbi:MAG: hypothetical protein QW612_04560 [Candidatus Bathyarchaeia archaeon]